ncbi:N-acetyl-gamma-glutamyl-phosphate reductase [Sphingobium sp. TA15]|uniref:N-acetyl-gamma-glutamyl-phosphate reductase n=2 Tax=Sphingobium indicum TaxID=332055 RepID=D4Z0G3_SPHIU|nr:MULTISPECIES: N-acetyl-gamma-glutamyl-phosphate reductase [Sphingobium]EPR16524.1 N-acetyl-gamma-glutamyl-phosphate reductase [Sphingobium indicum IP26]BDD65400.1 N-acetyl-gamma-glutamyl-phosphate reductase [Sphingobium sp. TA15]EQA99376.1 N-acetyl-gamma-glutamyl-phosphate reductase [Sphingobium sp. HDIP04]KER35728.1 N-acetyl-gamma-glutamyl-phosphate reductase [Sphingobium indicum F2]BAI96095.1 N-acetyl-gamma-glutamyl-phosphate reductase [Sphingobium indicum UT26S]
MTQRIFIDGGVGTTGLEINERLAGRPELSIIALDADRRKDASARRDALNAADIVILCLPDDAAREAVALIDNGRTRVIDASTAHRVADGWAYGFAELEPGHRERLANSRFVANPGCWPTGFLALVRPLVLAGLLPVDWPVTVSGASGYSGGGKSMIAEYEGAGGAPSAFRPYGLGLAHKHVPEMQRYSGLRHPPLFAPAVANAYRGMIVEVPLQLRALPGAPSAADVHGALAAAYAGSPIVGVEALEDSAAMTQVRLEHVGATDRLALFVFGNEATGQARLVAALDNLGKGAAGAAVQNLNILAGLPETAGLRL